VQDVRSVVLLIRAFHGITTCERNRLRDDDDEDDDDVPFFSSNITKRERKNTYLSREIST